MKGAIRMKKSNLWTGIGFVGFGVLCLVGAVCWDAPLGSILCGFAGAFAGPGIMMICKYRKWSRPENAAAYQERLEQEQIDLQDERKEMLRNKAGRYAYLLGLVLASLAIVGFSVLDKLGVQIGTRACVLFLGGYVIVQYVAGILIYRKLSKIY